MKKIILASCGMVHNLNLIRSIIMWLVAATLGSLMGVNTLIATVLGYQVPHVAVSAGIKALHFVNTLLHGSITS